MGERKRCEHGNTSAGCDRCWGVISPDRCKEIAKRLGGEAESALNDCALIMEAQSDELVELLATRPSASESTRSPAQNGSIGRGHDMFEEAVGVGEAMARLLARAPKP